MGPPATPEQMDKAHQAALSTQRGTEVAPSRPALGFKLDQTTHADIDAWADRAGIACKLERQTVLICKSVAPSLLGVPDVEGPVDTLSFAFDAKERLVDITAMRIHLSPEAAVATTAAITSSLEKQLGAPHTRIGAFDTEHLSQKGVAALSSVAYRFNDYAVDVMSNQFQRDGLILREHYASIANGS